MVAPHPGGRLAAGLLVVALLAGLGIASYLVAHHENQVYGDGTLTLGNCPQTETVNCDLVNSSPWSEIMGLPIAALALPTYLLLLGLIVASTFRDLRRFPSPLRRAAVAFVALLALTLVGDRALRSHVRAVAAAERARIEREGGPTVPAVPEDPEGAATPRERSSLTGWLVPDASAAEAVPTAAAQPYKLAGPLRRLEKGTDGLKSTAFDLQARIGRGKPIALIFWAPGVAWSKQTLVEMAAFFATETPQYEVYAVSGRRDGQRDEEIHEAFALLDLPAALPLLVDDALAVSTALSVGDVPNVSLFSTKGQLVIAKIKDLQQLLITAKGNREAVEIVREVAKGTEVPQIRRMFPYYPSSRLLDHCAPAFAAKVFGTGAPFAFTGRSKANRPTLVMFWSSTCAQCQVDIPQLVKWVSGHPGAVDVLGVTVVKKDRPGHPSHRAVIEAYIRSAGIPWTVVEDVDGVASDTYRSISTPTTVFSAANGAVGDVWYYAHEDDFDAAMERSLAKARAATGACRAP